MGVLQAASEKLGNVKHCSGKNVEIVTDKALHCSTILDMQSLTLSQLLSHQFHQFV